MPNFCSLIPSWSVAFCLLWDVPNTIFPSDIPILCHCGSTSAAIFWAGSQLCFLGNLVSGRSSPLSSLCKCGKDPSVVLMYLYKKILSKEKCWPRIKAKSSLKTHSLEVLQVVLKSKNYHEREVFMREHSMLESVRG